MHLHLQKHTAKSMQLKNVDYRSELNNNGVIHKSFKAKNSFLLSILEWKGKLPNMLPIYGNAKKPNGTVSKLLSYSNDSTKENFI
jgi:hypothetical protein